VQGPLQDDTLFDITSAINVAAIWSGGGFLTVGTLKLRLWVLKVETLIEQESVTLAKIYLRCAPNFIAKILEQIYKMLIQ
jgi:hypothetical protein